MATVIAIVIPRDRLFLFCHTVFPVDWHAQVRPKCFGARISKKVILYNSALKSFCFLLFSSTCTTFPFFSPTPHPPHTCFCSGQCHNKLWCLFVVCMCVARSVSKYLESIAITEIRHWAKCYTSIDISHPESVTHGYVVTEFKRP